jgi:hypothetical protein
VPSIARHYTEFARERRAIGVNEFIVDENARTDQSFSKAGGEDRSVMSVPIALETLIWIVFLF